ncbi:MAG: glutaredoxin family protein [bacterium]
MDYTKFINKIEGENRGDFLLFTLSTCIWCRKTKSFLDSLGVEYGYIDVDLVDGDEGEMVMLEMHKYNPKTSFPTIVVNKGEKVILGFEEDQIRESLK